MSNIEVEGDRLAARRLRLWHPRWQLVDHDPAVMDAVWRDTARPEVRRGRIFDLRLAHGLLRRGVQRLATRNVRVFEGLGFAEVFDPIGALPDR